MLDSELRDNLVAQVERAQVNALHRALDKAWLEGYKAASNTSKIRGENIDYNRETPE